LEVLFQHSTADGRATSVQRGSKEIGASYLLAAPSTLELSVTAMTIPVPPIAAMVMISDPQRPVHRSNAGANGTSNYGAHGTRGSISSVRAFLGAAHQTLRVRNHRRRHRSEESKRNCKTKFHKFSRCQSGREPGTISIRHIARQRGDTCDITAISISVAEATASFGDGSGVRALTSSIPQKHISCCYFMSALRMNIHSVIIAERPVGCQ
jgi:hypothetical protein